jgi:hypothetical protein
MSFWDVSINTASLKSWYYFHLSILLKMDRVSVDAVDPKTNLTNVYEGVPFARAHLWHTSLSA